ncbi:MAG: hypothetical protein EAZ52_07545 [Alphaproteobacteria bacterium]|nr:MAG: hypothetical protein EAZ52_07545 [Alphaproteobacteria bacterium]
MSEYEQLMQYVDQQVRALRQEMQEMMHGAAPEERKARPQRMRATPQRTRANSSRDGEAMLKNISRTIARRAGRNLGKQISAALTDEASTTESSLLPRTMLNDLFKGVITSQRNR